MNLAAFGDVRGVLPIAKSVRIEDGDGMRDTFGI